MSAARAAELGAPVRARILAYASCGVDPAIMGIGPVPAVRKVLERSGRSLDEIGVIELNEAFAAQALAVIDELGLDEAKVNPNGGAIALGHPIGATGAALTAKILDEMERGDHRARPRDALYRRWAGDRDAARARESSTAGPQRLRLSRHGSPQA